jgi:hypothetical protein
MRHRQSALNKKAEKKVAVAVGGNYFLAAYFPPAKREGRVIGGP